MLYAYIKNKKTSKRKTGIFSSIFLILGLFLVGQAVYPIASWYLFLLPTYSQGIVSPVAAPQIPSNYSTRFAPPVRASEGLPPTKGNNPSDSYQPTNWFVGAKPFASIYSQNSNPGIFNLSIPKLKIVDATVETGGDDLKKSLISWPTSALPGQYGVNIIFGHSELPQFANPKDYSGIFTSLMDLSPDDPIFVDYDGIRYKYLVVDKKVIEPTDLSVLEQRFDSSYVTLITCVPPGTLWKRGVVRARLAQI